MRRTILILIVQLIAFITCFGQTAKKNCPEPNKDFYPTLCSVVDSRDKDTEGDGRNTHYYEVLIEKAACVEPSDPDSVVIQKVQTWWNKYKFDCKCDRINFTIPNGNILKYGINPLLKSSLKSWSSFINLI